MKNTYANKPNTLQGFTSLYPYTKPSMKYSSKLQAFTIVELLIVIVVIAILATISIAAYTNIQQRAKNTAIINAASQSLKMIEAYVAEYGTYPKVAQTGTYIGVCLLAAQSGCIGGSGVVAGAITLKEELAKIGNLPQSVPGSGEDRMGIIYQYYSAYFVDGQSQPVMITYWLEGENKNCGLAAQTTSDNSTLSANGYTIGNDGGKTRCRVSVPGPAHS